MTAPASPPELDPVWTPPAPWEEVTVPPGWDEAAVLAMEGRPAEAAAVLEALPAAAASEFRAAAALYLDAGDYERALACAERALSLQVGPNTLGLLVHALWGDRKFGDLQPEVRARMREALEQAVELPGCPAQLFLWLDTRYEVNLDSERRVRVLVRAMIEHPDNPQFRLRLAPFLPSEVAPDLDPVAMLRPLVDNATLSSADVADLARILFHVGAPALALAAEAKLPTDDAPDAQSVRSDAHDRTVFRGRCLLAVGDHDAAARAFAATADFPAVPSEYRVAARCGEAKAYLALGRVGRAILALGAALDAWDEGEDGEAPYLYGTLNADVRGYPEMPAEIESVCAHFLTGPGMGRINGVYLGRLIWLYLATRYGGSVADMSEADGVLLEQAHRLAPSRAQTGRVAAHLISRGRVAEAVRLALKVAIDAVLQAARDGGPEDGGTSIPEIQLWGLPETESLSPEDRLALHGASMEALRAAHGRGTAVGAVIASWYRGCWRDALWTGKHWQELAEAAEAVAGFDDEREDEFAWFDLGYARGELGDRVGAEAAYREDLRVREYHGTYHNLAILLEKAGRLEEALAHLQRAIELDTTKDRRGWLKRLEDKLAKRREEEEFERTAPARWGQVEGPGRNLLAALTQITSFSGFEHLGRLAGMQREWAERHYKKLVRLGMVLEDVSGRWEVNPHVLTLIERERSHSVATQIIRADETIRYKPIFNSRTEFTIYQILTTLFPNQLVFPNMALSAVFQFERMKEVLDSDVFGYFLRAQVDFCVTHTGTYYPIIAFELDSAWHDDPKQQAKDDQKNYIFQVGGVPLLRLRPYGRPTPEAIRQDIINAVARCDQLLATNEKLAARLGDLDLDRFIAMANGATAAASDAAAAGNGTRTAGVSARQPPPLRLLKDAPSSRRLADDSLGAITGELEDEDDGLPF